MYPYSGETQDQMMESDIQSVRELGNGRVKKYIEISILNCGKYYQLILCIVNEVSVSQRKVAVP